MLMYLAKILTKHSRTFSYQEIIILLVFSRFRRLWRRIRKSLAFLADQSIWSQDNQRHSVFCFSLKMFYSWIVMSGLHDWFGSLGTDYGRYGRWPPLPPSVPRLPNQSFSPSYQFIHKTFFKLHQNTSWLWSSFFQISCSAQNARLFPIPLQILILFLKLRGKYHSCNILNLYLQMKIAKFFKFILK